MGNFCGKCGSAIDQKTGLCPYCDAVALDKVEEANTKQSLKRAKRRGFGAIIALVLVVLIVAAFLIFAISNGLIGNHDEEDAEKVQKTYITYLEKKLVPELGTFDSNHPETSNVGIQSVLISDLNNDNTDEFVVTYSQKNGDNVEMKIACYGYNENADDEQEESVELIGSITASSQIDYIAQSESFHSANQSLVYSFVYNEKTYIAYEYISWLDAFSYQCNIYSLENGAFVEVANVYRDNGGSGGANYVYSTLLPSDFVINNEDFDFSACESGDVMQNYSNDGDYILYYVDNESSGYSYVYDTYYASQNDAVLSLLNYYGIQKTSYVDEEAFYRIVVPDNVEMIYTYLYYWEYGENDVYEKYEINDYTNWTALIGVDDTTTAESSTSTVEIDTTTTTEESTTEAVTYANTYDDYDAVLDAFYDVCKSEHVEPYVFSCYCSYCKVDIDGDSSDELIVQQGESEQDRTQYVYTMKDGKAVELGSYNAWHLSLYDDTEGDGKLVGVDGTSLAGSIYSLTMNENSIEYEMVESFEDVSEYPEYPNLLEFEELK